MNEGHTAGVRGNSQSAKRRHISRNAIGAWHRNTGFKSRHQVARVKSPGVLAWPWPIMSGWAMLLAVHVGPVARHPLAGRTAFAKQPASGPVRVSYLGLAGDDQANRRFHGGPDKAVYSYPLRNYPLWAADLPAHADRFVAGGMGENLVVDGRDEDEVCLGDIFRVGTVRLQVSEPREPCNTLARVVGTTRIVKMMLRTGRCGWYSRVLDEGVLAAGDALVLETRPNPGWTIRRVARMAADLPATPVEAQALKTLSGLSPGWRDRALQAAGRGARP